MTIYTIANGVLATSKPEETKQIQRETENTATPKKPQSMMEGLGGMVPFIVIMGVFIFLMWNGQRKERKKKEEMLSAIKVGSEVVTIGGIMGEIASVTDDHFVIQISDNAKIKVLKSAVSQVVSSGNAQAGKDGK